MWRLPSKENLQATTSELNRLKLNNWSRFRATNNDPTRLRDNPKMDDLVESVDAVKNEATDITLQVHRMKELKGSLLKELETQKCENNQQRLLLENLEHKKAELLERERELRAQSKDLNHRQIKCKKSTETNKEELLQLEQEHENILIEFCTELMKYAGKNGRIQRLDEQYEETMNEANDKLETLTVELHQKKKDSEPQLQHASNLQSVIKQIDALCNEQVVMAARLKSVQENQCIN